MSKQTDETEPAVSAWEARTDLALTTLALLFLGVYAWQVLDVGMDRGLHSVLEGTLWVIWVLFAADYVIRLSLARRKLRFVGRHMLDLLAVALPMVRQLRALRLLTVLRVLNRRFGSGLRGRVGIYVAGTTLLIGLAAALAVLDAERRDPEANITTFGDALWWTLTTITTVGYGDRYPVTTEGRLIAATLMIGGIALIGVATGTIASWFLEKIAGAEDKDESTYAEVVAMRGELAALRAELAGVNRSGSSPP
ncbi:potassium channel family protein [Actinokineospora sp. UTMC 2448]|uniref:potassium channel family protein n=1 Tax=Actinokineospora sp. UTMC 2448 TaxID=2268449 RepID=UPI0021646430|nr:potassium channel family protein [Actinokineospora sp. UTMC 2448]UVS82563.1 K+ channel [Actinokineospora sp. UTMC 2448]